MTILHLIHKAILFAIEWVVGILLALFAICFAEFLALFVNKMGDLRQPLRALFQPIDNPCWGDASWIEEHPTYSKWRLSASYLRRNAAYGYQSLVSCKLGKNTIYGDTTIRDGVNGKAGWFVVINEFGCFQIQIIIPVGFKRCFRMDYGWSLINSSMLGSLQLVFIGRFYNFGV